ncbi:hypothetical protein [Nostoc sp.]|uniref:hypothetical protein n=1 Tax=Nostoc sp. TaxID=1180 RepID=UPI002FFB66C1
MIWCLVFRAITMHDRNRAIGLVRSLSLHLTSIDIVRPKDIGEYVYCKVILLII